MIICANGETSRELRLYLEAAGLRATGQTELSHAQIAAAEQAVVLFPDDFAAEDVFAHLQSARAARAETKLIVVTAQPQRFERALTRDGSSLGVIALPRPTFGWVILEAIRSDAR